MIGDEEFEDELDIQYLNNENPFTFLKDYNSNKINSPKNKDRLNTFLRLQQSKPELYLDPQLLMLEKKLIIEKAIADRKEYLIRKGLNILMVDNTRDPILLFEDHFYNKDILDIAIELRKLDLIFPQMKIRLRVGQTINTNNVESFYENTEKPIYDNFKEALMLEMLFNTEE